MGPYRRHTAVIALAAALTLAACSGDPAPAGPTAGGSAPDDAPPTATPAGETPSPATPTGSDTTGPGGELVTAVNLCQELDVAVLNGITDLQLDEGVFDGAACAWVDRDGRGTLSMSLGNAEGSDAAYIEEVKDLDIGDEATVAGADDAAAVTISSGSGASRSTRVGLVAKVGRDRLTVVLTSRDASVETVITIAELVTNP